MSLTSVCVAVHSSDAVLETSLFLFRVGMSRVIARIIEILDKSKFYLFS